MIIYSLWIALIALTFWFTKFDNNVTLMQALMDTGRYPSVVYPVWLRVIVTFIIPIAVCDHRAHAGAARRPRMVANFARARGGRVGGVSLLALVAGGHSPLQRRILIRTNKGEHGDTNLCSLPALAQCRPQ